MNDPCLTPHCSHSLSLRLSKKLALLTIAVIGTVFIGAWFSISMLIQDRNAEELELRCRTIADTIELEARAGGAAGVLARLRSDTAMRGSSRLEIYDAGGRLFFSDAKADAPAMSQHTRTHEFVVSAPELPGGPLRGRHTMDFSQDARMGQVWALVLTGLTLLAGTLAALGTWWQTRRQLRPLDDLANQTRAISAAGLHRRLSLADPAEELLPWIEQFNALMQRLERAYAQLEGFNADVAHELRTPLAALIGHTELALSRERSAEALRETMAGNLEELHRLSAMVNDMLFLASADRGAQARVGQPVSLAELTRQVVEFHEAPLEDAQLSVRIEGDARIAVDEPLFKRAVSNLIGNATRYAEPGSTVTVRIAIDEPSMVRLEVENRGPQIEPSQLPRIFDRFFRVDASRNCPEEQKHHGLGLAIVAAIARMHAGEPLAQSRDGRTSVGMRLPVPG